VTLELPDGSRRGGAGHRAPPAPAGIRPQPARWRPIPRERRRVLRAPRRLPPSACGNVSPGAAADSGYNICLPALVFTSRAARAESRSSGRHSPRCASRRSANRCPATTTEDHACVICRASVRACFAVSCGGGSTMPFVAHAESSRTRRAPPVRLPVLHLERHADCSDESSPSAQARSPTGTAASRDSRCGGSVRVPCAGRYQSALRAWLLLVTPPASTSLKPDPLFSERQHPRQFPQRTMAAGSSTHALVQSSVIVLPCRTRAATLRCERAPIRPRDEGASLYSSAYARFPVRSPRSARLGPRSGSHSSHVPPSSAPRAHGRQQRKPSPATCDRSAAHPHRHGVRCRSFQPRLPHGP